MSTTHKDLVERIALFRHSLIARVLPSDLTPQQRQQEMVRISHEQHQIPGTLRTRVAHSTLREWLKLYREGGFDALKPRKRGDTGHPKALAAELAEQLLQCKEREPDLSIRLVIEQLRGQGVIGKDQHVPISTVHRLFKSHGVMTKGSMAEGGVKEDRRRFAYQEAGQLWMSDVMHGPSVPGPDGRRKKKTYLIAFIDDATRVIPHAQFAFAENTREFLPVFKIALLKRGLPQRLLVDNGANYRSHHFSIVCAKLGVALIHAKPFQPQSKGKIERFFRTVRAQLLTRLIDNDPSSLEALNRRLAAWVEGEYHHSPHRGVDGDTPLERWARVADGVCYPDQTLDLADLFLFEEQRKVQNDRIVSLRGRLFEVDASLIGEKVILRYDPSRPDAPVQVVHKGALIEKARQVDLYANCSVKRQRQGSVQTYLTLSREITDAEVRESVFLVGYPTIDNSFTVEVSNKIFKGVTGVKRLMLGKVIAEDDEPPLLIHDALTSAGTSGAPVIDLESGEVLGVHYGRDNIGQGLAIPSWAILSDPSLISQLTGGD